MRCGWPSTHGSTRFAPTSASQRCCLIHPAATPYPSRTEKHMTQNIRTDDGVMIEYNVYGSGPLTPLFLHGWGNAANSWDELITTRLNLAGLRCVAATYRGHGGSDEASVRLHSRPFCARHVRRGRCGWCRRFRHDRVQHGREVRTLMATYRGACWVRCSSLRPGRRSWRAARSLHSVARGRALPGALSPDPVDLHETTNPAGLATTLLSQCGEGLARRARGNHRHVL